ncbi:MAG: hypothetical protein H0X47_06875 [Nitrospirales bacterium]|nr:hypothetical protein [Nitrospirales bacterium]
MITNPEEFQECLPANIPCFLERSSGLIRRILQDTGQWADNTAHEKLVLRLSFDLIERFIEYCPSQLPCRPLFLLNGFISDFFGKLQESKASSASHPILYRFLDGLLNRAVLSRDALICLFYHFYGMKPVEVGFLLGLEEGQTQRIYKNFARWRRKGWYQAAEEIGLTTQDVQTLGENQASDPETFNQHVRENLETLLPFYRKSDPPYYPCLDGSKWQEMFSEGSGFDYRMWHLPLGLSCMNEIASVGNAFLFNVQITILLSISPHSQKEEEPARQVHEIKVPCSSRMYASCSSDFQPA